MNRFLIRSLAAVLLCLGLSAPALATGAVAANRHRNTITYDTTIGVSVDADGFTYLPARVGANTYYVNSSTGNNANSCTAARTVTTPKATLAAGVACVTAGQGDHVLLAEGTTYAEAMPWLAFVGGFSATYPTVISSYDPADPANELKIGMGHQRSARPVLTASPTVVSGGPFSYVAIKGIDFNPGNIANQGLGMVGDGTGFTGGANYLLVENNLFRYMGLSIDSAQSQTSPPNSHHIVIRNNSIFGVWADNASIHVGGIYIAGTDGLTIEDNVVWHTGWRIGAARDDNPTSAANGGAGLGGGPTVFNHPVYLQTNSAIETVRRNLFVDNAADAGIARGDGILWAQNVSLQSPAGTGLGGGPDYNTERPNGVAIEAKYNLSAAAINLTSTNPSGYGYTTGNGTPGSSVHHNLLIVSTVTTSPNSLVFSNSASFNQPSYMEHERNVARTWSGSTCYYSAGGLFPAQAIPFTTYDNNSWDCAAAGTNTVSSGLTFNFAYTEAQLYTAIGYADLNALTTDVSTHPEKHVQRKLLSIAFAGYRRPLAPVDSTAPTLTSPTGSSPSAGNATIGVTTNDSTGTLYYELLTTGTAPHVSRIKMGVNGSDVAGTSPGSLLITSAGAKSVNLSSVPAGTYFAHFMHEDFEGNKSLAATSASFTVTSAAATWDGANSSTDWTLSGGNLIATRSSNTSFWAMLRATTAKTSGTIIVQVNAVGGGLATVIGFDTGAETVFPGNDGAGRSIGYRNNGDIDVSGGVQTTGASYTNGDCVKATRASNIFTFYKQTACTGSFVLQGTVDATAAGAAIASVAAYPAASNGNSTGTQLTLDASGW